MIDAALLGRLEAFLDARLRDEERGRDERCARLEDFGRGPRGMEIGRWSGVLGPER